MFEVYIEALLYNIDHLQQMSRKLKAEISRMDDVFRTLRGLSGMDGVLSRLRKDREKMDEEEKKIIMMLQALDKILMAYNTAESKIYDNAEYEAAVVDARVSLTRNIFSDQSELQRVWLS